MTIKISELAAGADPSADDLFAVAQSGNVTTKVKFSQLQSSANIGVFRKQVEFNPVIPDGERIQITTDPGFRVGDPVTFKQGDTLETSRRWATVVAWDGTFITISGPDMTGNGNVTELTLENRFSVVQVDLLIPGAYCQEGITSGVPYLLRRETFSQMRWRSPIAYLTSMSASHLKWDSGASQPQLNVLLSGQRVFNTHIQMPSDSTWVTNVGGSVNDAQYRIDFTEDLEIELVAAGENNDSKDLSIALTFITEL